MIGSVNNGFQNPAPASRAFDVGQAPNNPSNTPKVPDGPQPAPNRTTSVAPGVTEEINSQVALSRDTTRPDPSQIGNDSQQRGARLDISV